MASSLCSSESLSPSSCFLFKLAIDNNTFSASPAFPWTISHRQDSGTHLEEYKSHWIKNAQIQIRQKKLQLLSPWNAFPQNVFFCVTWDIFDWVQN